jgi:hypothetical protein
MSFLPIGFAANLILNRLRNEREIAEHNAANDGDREQHDREEEETRTKLERVNKRLALLRARVGEN